MRKQINIAVVVLLYASAWFGAGLLLRGENSQVSADIARWLWGLGVLIITTLGQLAWKVHEAKRVDGLSSSQRLRVRQVAGLIGTRIYILMAIVFLSCVVGFFSSFVTSPKAGSLMAQTGLGFTLASAVVWLVWTQLAQRDLQRFEDKAREEVAKRNAAQALADRLKMIKPT